MRHGETGRERQGPVEAGKRLVMAVCLAESHTEMEMGLRRVGIEGKRAVDELKGARILAALEANDAGCEQRLVLVGLCGENLRKQRLCLRQRALPISREGASQKVCDVDRGTLGHRIASSVSLVWA